MDIALVEEICFVPIKLNTVALSDAYGMLLLGLYCSLEGVKE